MAGYFGNGGKKGGLPAVASKHKQQGAEKTGWHAAALSIEATQVEKRMARGNRQLDGIKQMIDTPGGAEAMAQRIRVMLASGG